MADTVDNTLSFLDQGSFLWVRASGHVHCIQATWVYRRAIDLDGLRRMQDNLAHGLLGRRIERSPLPFGRHRWVAWREPPEIEIAEPALTPEAVTDWTARRGQIPINPESGPPWHIGVLPIDGYGTAVSLLISHTVIDALGLCLALAAAANGVRRDLGYPPPRSRPWWRALGEDARVTARDVPAIGRAIVAGVREAGRLRKDRPAKPAPPAAKPADRGADRPTDAAIVRVFIDVADWDARAKALGGTGNALFAGFAARIGERVGRVRASDGKVFLTYPVNHRAADDTNGNPLKSIDLVVDPASVLTDLREVRAEIKQALTLELGAFKEQEAVLPLVPLTPKALVRRLAVDAVGASELPVGCANLGDIDPAVACVDGTQADSYWMNLVGQNLTQNSPEFSYGEMLLTSGRIGGTMFIAVRCYKPGAVNWRRELCGHIADTLADYNLTAVIE